MLNHRPFEPFVLAFCAAAYVLPGCAVVPASDEGDDPEESGAPADSLSSAAGGGASQGAGVSGSGGVGQAGSTGGASGGGGLDDGSVDAGAGGMQSGGAFGAGGVAAGTGGVPPIAECNLRESGAITSTSEGQVIENLHIVVTSGTALTVSHDDVTVRNVWIEHRGGKGLFVNGADGVKLESVLVEYTGAPESGPNPDSGHVNIQCQNSADLRVDGALLLQGSSGIYLVGCPDAHLSFIEGHDFRGPFPRGQVVQFNDSDRGILEDFSVISPPGSWPEDNVNVYKSQDVVVRRGIVDGNNAPSGVGVIFDGGTSTGLVEDVDAVRMGNGCFSGYAGAADVTFRRTRCSENICASQDGRGAPASNSLMWAGNPSHSSQRIEDSAYQNSCNGNLVWPMGGFSVVEVSEASFALRSPIELSFCFE